MAATLTFTFNFLIEIVFNRVNVTAQPGHTDDITVVKLGMGHSVTAQCQLI